MTVKAYTETLLKDESALDGHSYNLYRFLILAIQTYTESTTKSELYDSP